MKEIPPDVGSRWSSHRRCRCVRFGDKRASEAASETTERGDGGGVPWCSAQCDAWALGVTLHVLLTAPPPPLNSDQCKNDSVWLNMQKGEVRAAPRLPAVMRLAHSR